jgi:hypothetical protein
VINVLIITGLGQKAMTHSKKASFALTSVLTQP